MLGHMNNLKILGILVVAASAQLSCDDPKGVALDGAEKVVSGALKKSMKVQIERALKAKYAVRFDVVDSYFEMGLNLYVFTAAETNSPNIIFEGNFDERKKDVKEKITSDGYINQKFSYEAEDYFSSLLDKKYGKAFGASVYSRLEHRFGEPVPSLDEYLKNRIEKSTIRSNRYFFEIPKSASDPVVTEIGKMLHGLHKKYRNNYSLYIGFWPPGFLEGKKLEKLTFGFEATSMEDADNLLNVIQYMERVFFVKVVNGSIDQLTNEKIFELIKPANKNGPDSMVEI